MIFDDSFSFHSWSLTMMFAFKRFMIVDDSRQNHAMRSRYFKQPFERGLRLESVHCTWPCIEEYERRLTLSPMILEEFRAIRVSGANLQRFSSSGFVWSALPTDVSWKWLCTGQSRLTSTELNCPKFAQKFTRCKGTTTWEGLIWFYSKLAQNF